jgi:hypothetical protein
LSGCFPIVGSLLDAKDFLHGLNSSMLKAIDGFHFVEQKFDQQVLIVFIGYHQVDIPILDRNCNTLPAFEWHLVNYIVFLEVKVHSHHPKSGGKTAKIYLFNVVNMNCTFLSLKIDHFIWVM